MELLAGFADILLDPQNLLYLTGGVALGLIMGSIPGLTATMAIALIIPFSYKLETTQSLIMLMGCYNGGIFGGSVSAILLSTPGTPSSAATVADGYGLAKQGKASKAIKMSIVSSVWGCLFSCIVLVLVAEPIARFALNFGPGEFTVIMIFSLTIIGSTAGKSISKGLIGGALGMLFGCVGLDPMTSTPRLTFGTIGLMNGIDIVVMLIGSLALSEILIQVEAVARGKKGAHLPEPKCKEDQKLFFHELKSCFKTLMRSSVIGCAIGALPGLGPTLATYIGYDAAKKGAKHPEEFGKGSLEGVAGAEAANNAVCGANLIPLLALGVPGDTVAAILIGAFMLQGIVPGPMIFSTHGDVVYGLYAGLIISNIILLAIVLIFQRYFVKIVKVETTIIYPIVIMFCLVGVYALNQTTVDLWIMLFFAVLGYLMIKFDFSPASMMIGLILSPLFETNMRQALIISNGSYGIFFNSWICDAFWVATALSIVTVVRSRRKEREREREKASGESQEETEMTA